MRAANARSLSSRQLVRFCYKIFPLCIFSKIYMKSENEASLKMVQLWKHKDDCYSFDDIRTGNTLNGCTVDMDCRERRRGETLIFHFSLAVVLKINCFVKWELQCSCIVRRDFSKNGGGIIGYAYTSAENIFQLFKISCRALKAMTSFNSSKKLRHRKVSCGDNWMKFKFSDISEGGKTISKK